MCLKRAFRGQALNEYAMPIALIALVSIPALVILSGNLGDYTKDTSDTIKGNPNAALSAAGLSINDAWMGVTTGKGLGPYQGEYDMDNGIVRIKLPDFLGGGHANFSEGAAMTREIAALIAKIAREYRDEYGNPLPSDIKKRVDKLADIGSKLADEEARVNAQLAAGESGNIDMWKMIELYDDYAAQYRSVMQELQRMEDNGLNLQIVEDTVKGYSGVISGNAYANYLNNIDKGAGNSSYYSDARSGLVGDSPRRTTSRGNTPTVTRHGSQRIDSVI